MVAQSAPAQLEAYKFQIASFEAANPGIKVVFEPTSDEGYAAQLAAAFASGQVPNVVTHLPSFAVTNYWRNGLLEPFNDVIQAIGPENFYDGANRIYEIEPGQYAGTGIGNTAANMLWLRTDLMQKAGIDKAPTHLGRAARGRPRRCRAAASTARRCPTAKNSMTTLIFIGFIHGAGGQVFTPDLAVAIDSEETLNALEFYKSMRELCPPGATGYSWGESLTAFVSGATATGIYTGRVLANVNAQNPAHRGFDHLPHLSDRSRRTCRHGRSTTSPASSSRRRRRTWRRRRSSPRTSSRAEGYIKQLHAAPGHVLPVLKTIADDPEYHDNPIISEIPEGGGAHGGGRRRRPQPRLRIRAAQARTSRPARSSPARHGRARAARRASTTRTPRRRCRDTAQKIESDLTKGVSGACRDGVRRSRRRRHGAPGLERSTAVRPARRAADRADGADLLRGHRLSAGLGDLSQPVLHLHADPAGPLGRPRQLRGARWRRRNSGRRCWINLIWTAGTLALQIVLGVALALLLHQNILFRSLARSLILFPYFVSTVVAVLVWRWLFNDLYGILNHLLMWAGLLDMPLDWLGRMPNAMVSVILVGAWKYFPFVVIACWRGCRPSPTTSTRRRPSTAPGAGRASSTSRCRSCATCWSSSSCCARSGTSRNST